jgi:hypothetical protein
LFCTILKYDGHHRVLLNCKFICTVHVYVVSKYIFSSAYNFVDSKCEHLLVLGILVPYSLPLVGGPQMSSANNKSANFADLHNLSDYGTLRKCDIADLRFADQISFYFRTLKLKGSDQRKNRWVWSNVNTRYLVWRCGDGGSFAL